MMTRIILWVGFLFWLPVRVCVLHGLDTSLRVGQLPRRGARVESSWGKPDAMCAGVVGRHDDC